MPPVRFEPKISAGKRPAAVRLLMFNLRIVVTVGRPDHEHSNDCHHDTKVKPEAATAVIELLMMGGKTPETR